MCVRPWGEGLGNDGKGGPCGFRILFFRGHIEQQVRLYEGLGILMEESYFLRHETSQETVERGEGRFSKRFVMPMIHTTI